MQTVSKSLHERLLSEKHRLNVINKIRRGEIQYFSSLKWDEDAILLELHLQLPILPQVAISELYHRDETKTIVFKLKSNLVSIVLKLYLIGQRPAANADEALNYEIEIRYLKLFEELIQKSICPHYALGVGHSVLTASSMKGLIADSYIVENGKYMCLLGECADTSLWKLIQTQHISLQCLATLILQVVICLFITQDILPSFRHNDLHAANILIQNLESRDGHFRYDIYYDSYFWILKHCPYRCLIWDMYYASIAPQDTRGLSHLVPAKKELFNDKAASHTRTCQNQYFDLHKFFDSLHYILTCTNSKTPMYPEISKLIDFVLPQNLRCMSRNLSHEDKTAMRIWEIEHLSAKSLIENEFFNPFRRQPKASQTVIRVYKHPFVSERSQKAENVEVKENKQI
jgi:hypothetical protein